MLSGISLFSGWHFLRRALAGLALVAFSAWGAETVEVSIAEYRFTPAEVQLKSGDSVRWTNQEKRTSHSIVFPEEGGRESERLFPGESWVRRFEQPGRYPYRCGPHPEMKGVILVD